MNPHFFFQGKLSREESASAFLATLIEQSAGFRTSFLAALGIREPAGCFRVLIEKHDVDIRIDYPNDRVIVLVECKVRPGALQVNQLVRYYRHARKSAPNARIHTFMIAPGEGVGTSEVRRLIADSSFDREDLVCRISWRELADLQEVLGYDGVLGDFARSGFDCIARIIDQAAQEKYPLVAGREIANEIVQGVMADLTREFPAVRFSSWRGRDVLEVFSVGTGITVYVDLVFRVDDTPPYAPLEIPDRDHVTGRLRTQFKLSARGRRDRTLRDEWDRWIRTGVKDVGGSGPHVLAGRWFVRDMPISGDAAHVRRELTAMGRAVVREVLWPDAAGSAGIAESVAAGQVPAS
jgi:hypothetical protein